MEFLAPIFAVAGALAAGVPLILHMMRRVPIQLLPFSLVQFLNPVQPEVTRRFRIDYWPLLLLRILALVLLCLAFARPFQRSTENVSGSGKPGRSIALLIDRSASMRRTGIRDAVLQTLRSTVENLDSEDCLRVALFSNTVTTVISAESWAAFSSAERSAAITRLCSKYMADWHGTQTGIALQQTAEDLVQEFGPRTEHRIILVTDFQEGSDFGSLLTGIWPDSVQVTLRIIRPLESGNASLHTMVDRRTAKLLVRVSNNADATTTHFTVRPLNRAGLSAGPDVPVNVVPGRQVTLPLTSLTLTEDAVSLSLVGDSHKFDNCVPLPVTSSRTWSIAHAGSTDVNDASRMRYYLQRALDGMARDADPDSSTEPQPEILDTVTSDGLTLPVPDDVKLAILTEAVPVKLLPSLKALLDRDGIVVAALTSELMAQSIQALLPEGMTITEASVSDYAMLGRIDFEQPLFAEFSDARFADFSSVRFWKHRAIGLAGPDSSDAEEAARWTVVAEFDSGMPAIVRIRREFAGEVYLLASGWHPDDSQWALSSRFAPMVTGFLNLAHPAELEYQQVLVGDSFNPATTVTSSDWIIELPDGSLQSCQAVDSRKSEVTQITVEQPGRYTIRSTSADDDTTVTLLAEIDPNESRTAPLPEGQLYALGLAAENTQSQDPVLAMKPPESRRPSADQLESQQKYWRWFLLAGLCCLFAEAVLAAIIHRRQLETA